MAAGGVGRDGGGRSWRSRIDFLISLILIDGINF